MRRRSKVSRREFLGATAVLGGAVASGTMAAPAGAIAAGPPAAAAPGAGGAAPGASPGTSPGTSPGASPGAAPAGALPRRALGRTGLRVSEIGFGGYPVADPDVVLYALDRGINSIDTSNCYRGGASETVIGRALKGRRDRFVVTTKWCPHHVGRRPTKDAFLAQLDASLRRLQTDYVDVLLNHEVGRNSDGQGPARLRNPEMFEAWEAARRAGKARFLGASGHDPDLMEVMHGAVDDGRFDVLLCRYSFLDYPDQDRLISKAHARGVGFVAMKTLAGARGADLDRFKARHVSFKQAALRWVLSNPKVSHLVISINNTRQVDEYAAAAGGPLTRADNDVLDAYAREFSSQVCRVSGACLAACPEDVRISDILRFSMYHDQYGERRRGVESYAGLPEAARASRCLDCSGFCEQACAYDLPVRTLMIRADATLGGGRPPAGSTNG